ncbi:DUF6394 family protein [Rhabdochromatium marinum]|uniref:DUF6394 family protein n=1 Tax=Rhabdochromatium marinum TaxID=48729 RepID=UPI00190427C4|nr:DUF6394 family protein [Rhabdochromatium marinum]MBK1647871.1 hypothetical protein [Rhabdochromatium marinum]
MNLEKVVFGFFIFLALTLNFGFFIGEVDNPKHHHLWEFMLLFVVNAVALIMKLGDRSQVDAMLLATGLVAMLQLSAVAVIWILAAHVWESGMTPDVMVSIVSLTGGAMVANVISVILLIAETVMLRR